MYQNPYASASIPRAMALDTVANQGAASTAIKALVYVNNQLVQQSPPFMSGQDPVQGSRYSNWSGAGSEVRKSKRDAEVHVLDWAYGVARQYENNRDVQSFQIDLAVGSGTCNECKERQQRFTNDIARMLPGTYSNTEGRYRIIVQPLYANNRQYPAVPGRPNPMGQPMSTYGYGPTTGVERRVSAVASDNGARDGQAEYWSRKHVVGGGSGYTDPRTVDRTPLTDEPRTDRYSPNQSPRTPSPKRPGQYYDEKRGAEVFPDRADKPKQWYAVDKSAKEGYRTIESFDARRRSATTPAGPSQPPQGQARGAAR